MMWPDFIEKIKTFRKSTKSLGLNAPSLIRLLFSGAFDDMLPKELFEIPAQKRYTQLTVDLLSALGSKSKIPKKSKTDVIGLNEVESLGHLMLWRYSTNPFSRYEITSFCKTFLSAQGFAKPQYPSDDVLWVKAKGRTLVEIRKSWSGLFTSHFALSSYENGSKMLALVGIVVKTSRSYTHSGKPFLTITLFNGNEYVEGIKLWAKDDGTLNQAMVSQLKPGEMGLAYIKPKPWNDKPSGSLINWTPILRG